MASGISILFWFFKNREFRITLQKAGCGVGKKEEIFLN